MANVPTDHHIDIELGVQGSAIQEAPLPQTHTNSDASPTAPRSSSPENSRGAQPSVPQAEGAGENVIRESIRSSRNQEATGGGDPPEEPRMIGDFDSGADDLWTLYGKVAESFDESQVAQAVKEQMNDVFLFAGLFAASLTPFIIDSKQSLKVNPADQMVYYLQQHSALLSQISQQISVIAPQVSIPSAPPPPFPTFKPSASDMVTNQCWFGALVFSLTAGLLALIIQRCARDYMAVFKRYNDPLKRARHRQYLYEGWLRWAMPAIAEFPQGLLHMSLFLFFAGLCNVVSNINATIAASVIMFISYCALFYILSITAPMMDPQSPYRNSYSLLVWYMTQKLRGIAFKYWKIGDNSHNTQQVNTNFADAQLDFAMEETGERKGRDGRAIGWLVLHLTDDADVDSLVKAIPGSFNADWGLDVWDEFSRITLNSRTTTPLPQTHHIVSVLSTYVVRLLKTCHTPRFFRNERERQLRTRACVETTALLICCTDSKFPWFESIMLQLGDITRLLGDIGRDQTIRKSSLEGKDTLFVIRWTCLSLMVTCPTLEGSESLRERARKALESFQKGPITGNDALGAFPNVLPIDNKFYKAWGYLDALYRALVVEEYLTKERVVMVLRNHEHQISEVEKIKDEAESFRNIDRFMSNVESYIDTMSHGILTRYLPGVQSDRDDHQSDSEPTHPSRFVKLPCDQYGLHLPDVHSDRDDHQTEPTHPSKSVKLPLDPRKLQFIFPGQNLERICSLVSTFRDIGNGKWDVDTYDEALKNLKAFIEVPAWKANVVQRQVYRLMDLRDGGFGFTIELFFLALKPVLSLSLERPPHSTLYINTFRLISADWSKYKDSKGTQNFLLRMVLLDGGIIPSSKYPTYITDLFLELLRNILEGLSSYDHVRHTVLELRNINPSDYGTPDQQRFLDEVMGIFNDVL